MHKQVSVIFTSILILISISVSANEGTALSRDLQTFEVGVSISIPPWVIQENDSGIELDLLRAGLGEERFEVKPIYVPFERAYQLFDDGQLDAVINAKANVVKTGFLSQPVVTLQNYAISLASKAYPTNISMAFLKDKSVVAFQKANQLLGDDYAEMARLNPHYREVTKQNLQINLLFLREIDFVVMDKSIFGYYWYQASKTKKDGRIGKDRFKQKITFHPLFEPSPYPFLFKDKGIRDEFNQGLSKMKKSGQYQQIIDRYDHLSDLYQP